MQGRLVTKLDLSDPS